MRPHLAWSMALVALGSFAAAGGARADEVESGGERGAGEKGGEETARVVPPHAMTAPAWDTLAKAADGARIEKIELKTEDDRTVYEATVLSALGDRYEIQVDVDGKLIEKELKER